MPQEVASVLTSQRHTERVLYSEAITKQVIKEISDMESRIEQSNKLLEGRFEQSIKVLESSLSASMRSQFDAMSAKLDVNNAKLDADIKNMKREIVFSILKWLAGFTAAALLLPAVRHALGF